MYKLYGRQGTGSDAPRYVLEEAHVEYEFIDVSDSAQAGDKFAVLNPLRQLPVLMLPTGTVVSESGAISFLLAEAHPETGLLPEIGTDERAEVFRWMFFAATNLYEACRRHYHADAYIEAGGFDALRRSALDSLFHHWKIVDTALAGRTALVGTSRSMIDIYLAMLADWMPDRTELWRECPSVAALCQAVGESPAARTVGIAQS